METRKSPSWTTYVTELIFIGCLCIGFIIRYVLLYKNFNIEDTDITSVYHIANHIITYKEFPILGEPNSLYSLLLHSPLYFYIISLALLVHNSIFTLGILGMILQFVFIILIYKLALVLFNKSIALTSGILLIVNQALVAQTHVMFQRWIEQPLFAASYLFLALAYTKNSHTHIVYAVICFTTALGVELHGYAALPLFFLLVAIILYKTRAPLLIYIAIVAIACGIWVMCYAPVLLHLAQNNNLSFLFREQVYITSPLHYFKEFVLNIEHLFQGTFASDLFTAVPRIGMFATYMILMESAILYKKIKYSPYYVILIAYIFSVLLIASFISDYTKDYYFVSIFGPFVILLAALTQSLKRQTKLMNILSITALALLISMGAPSVYFLQQNHQKNTIYEAQIKAVQSIKPYIHQLKQQDKAWASNTSIEAYGKTVIGRRNPIDNIFWPIFENETQTQLSQTITGFTFPLAAKPSHIFTFCENYDTIQSAINECRKAFLTQHPDFNATLIYATDPNGKYFIFLGERNDQALKR